jgi:L-ascorbate metabolism protein UlaG (beta-lactamase superfamily)
MLKILKFSLFAIIGLVLVVVLIAAVFVKTSPEFGGEHSDADKLRYSQSGHFEKGIFINETPTSMEMDMSKIWSILSDYANDSAQRTPDFEIPVKPIDSLELIKDDSLSYLVWFGHSAFYLKIDGKHILLDPMLGVVPAPHPLLGQDRFNKVHPIDIEKLPEIDAIILSHDHYDHLDYGSIMKLKDKTAHFYVPLGVGAHLKSWGITEEKITEMNWWDESNYKDLKIAFTPSRHFSGRGLSDRSSTLWGSWVIQGDNDNIYFSGDGGYGPHFKEIGVKYGPFDFAMMECGQYDLRWKDIHMMPEETAQASIDLVTKKMMPIHWGAFSLSLHSWTDPIERVSKKSEELGQPIIAPIIGEKIYFNKDISYDRKWWIK